MKRLVGFLLLASTLPTLYLFFSHPRSPPVSPDVPPVSKVDAPDVPPVVNRVFCLVPTIKGSEDLQATVLETWGPQCDRLYLIQNEKTGRAHNMVINMTRPERDVSGKPARHIWEKVWRGLLQAYREHLDEAEWFVKIDLDTYFFANHLRTYVEERGFHPDDPHYFGHVLRHQQKEPMVAGTASVLSRGALRVLGPYLERLGTDQEIPTCKDNPGVEEARVARCLREVHVHPTDAFDGNGRETFLILDLPAMLRTRPPKTKWWYYRGNPQTNWGEECCSDRPIAVHKVALRTVHAYLTTQTRTYPSKDAKVRAYWDRVRSASRMAALGLDWRRYASPRHDDHDTTTNAPTDTSSASQHFPECDGDLKCMIATRRGKVARTDGPATAPAPAPAPAPAVAAAAVDDSVLFAAKEARLR